MRLFITSNKTNLKDERGYVIEEARNDISEQGGISSSDR